MASSSKKDGWHRLPLLVSWIRSTDSVQNERWQTCVGWFNTFWVQGKWCTFHFWIHYSFNCRPRKKMYLLFVFNISFFSKHLWKWIGVFKPLQCSELFCHTTPWHMLPCPWKAVLEKLTSCLYSETGEWVFSIINYCQSIRGVHFSASGSH